MSTEIDVIESLTRGEIDVQIETAKKYPRDLKQFGNTAKSLATMDQETATACLYALKRKNPDGTVKIIDGPSARLAEIIAHSWGNCRAGARVVSDEGSFVTAQGIMHDLENNVAITFEVRRRITNKNGRRYTDDMVGVTANAACSIALRNAVFKVVPKAFWQPVYQAARTASLGKSMSLADRKKQAVDYFTNLGVDEADVWKAVNRTTADAVTLDDVLSLRGIANAISEGEITVQEAFFPKSESGPQSKATTIDDLAPPTEQPEGSPAPPTDGDSSPEAAGETVEAGAEATTAEAGTETGGKDTTASARGNSQRPKKLTPEQRAEFIDRARELHGAGGTGKLAELLQERGKTSASQLSDKDLRELSS